MAKMNTIKKLAVGTFAWDKRNKAHIERNLFAKDGEAWEALRFCKTRNGRHNRVHLVISEKDFAELFADAIREGVFHAQTLERIFQALEEAGAAKAKGRAVKVPDIVGLFSKGSFSNEQIDDLLYGEFQK